jgi:hypothetical protein
MMFLTYQQKLASFFVPCLQTFYIKKKDKEDLLSSIVAPLIAPNTSNFSGHVCLGRYVLSKNRVPNLPNFIVDNYFSSLFYIPDRRSIKNPFRFKNNHYSNSLNNFLSSANPSSSRRKPFKIEKVK